MASLFTKIVDREIPAEIVYEDDLCIALKDIKPKAPTHLLVVPKKEIVSMADLTPEDEAVMGRCMRVAAKVAADAGLSGGYRCVVNTGRDGGQEIPHLHIHVLGGRTLHWPPG